MRRFFTGGQRHNRYREEIGAYFILLGTLPQGVGPSQLMMRTKKGLKGELIGGTNVRRKLNHATLFFMSQEDADKLCDFIIKHASQVEKAERYSS